MSSRDAQIRGHFGKCVLTPASTPTMPGVRPLNHPAFLQGRKTFRADWPCLHFDVPAWTMLSHPGVQSVIVILLVRKNRDETRKMVGVDVPEQERGRPPGEGPPLT